MKSKIINMADRLSDSDDRFLEALFAAEPIADDGFSDRVTSRLRRRVWSRRMCLGVAVVVGFLIAFRPLADVVSLAYRTLLNPSNGLLALPAEWIPTAHTTVAGVLLFGAVMLGLSMLED